MFHILMIVNFSNLSPQNINQQKAPMANAYHWLFLQHHLLRQFQFCCSSYCAVVAAGDDETVQLVGYGWEILIDVVGYHSEHMILKIAIPGMLQRIICSTSVIKDSL